MPTYRITNRITKERAQVDAPFAQVACERLGWLIGNCHVELIREGPYSDIAKAPERVCPSCGWPAPYHDGDRCLMRDLEDTEGGENER